MKGRSAWHRKRYLLSLVLVVGIGTACFFAVTTSQTYKNFTLDRECQLENPYAQKSCWAQRLAQRVADGDVTDAFRSVAYLYENRFESRKDCSDVTTELARALSMYEFAPRSVRWAPESAYCNFSFFKEYPRSILQTTGDLDRARDFCEYIAESFSDRLRYSIDCYRGIGYALVYTVPGADSRTVIQNVIEACEAIVSRPEDREGCVEGGFNRVSFREREQSLEPDATADPLALCMAQAPQYQDRCLGTFKGSAFLETEDLTTPISEITRIVTAQHADTPELDTLLTYLEAAYGWQRAYQGSVYESYEHLIRSCATEDGEYRQECLYGVTDGLVKNGTPGFEYRELIGVCQAIQRAGEYQCVTDSTLTFLKTYYGPAKFARACAVIEEETPIRCTQGS